MDQSANLIRTEHWKAVVLEANNSGLPKREWCAQNKINEKTFYYWQRKLRRMEAEKMLSSDALPAVTMGAEKENTPAFVDVTHLYQEDSSSAVKKQDEVTFAFSPQLMLMADQYRILIGDDVKEATLSTVLRAIRNA